ncbi:growth/differentiation factor 2-like [Bacillus rossius redtenbacheri]|uniref:growth/differentiation factor 2-like n=1 Tax=Bacillus rossius redtenbacheri TaxID=93214 RepID=UPI002FDDE833
MWAARCWPLLAALLLCWGRACPWSHHVPRHMMDLYRRAARAPGDVVRSLHPSNTSAAAAAGEDGGPHLLVFDVPPPGAGETLLAAELRLLVAHSGRGRGRAVRARAPGGGPQAAAAALGRGPGVSLDVTAALRQLRGDARGARRLRLELSSERRVRWPHLRPGASLHELPLLLLHYSSGQEQAPAPTRRRRGAPDDYEEETNSVWDDDAAASGAPRRSRRRRNACRRRPLYVDFAEIEYDSWIVAPSGYEVRASRVRTRMCCRQAFQCVGKCFFPVSEHLTPTKHAIVQTLLHGVSPGKVSRACCVPTRLEPISVLYLDQRGVLTYRFSFQDMVVAECGCR